MDNHGSYANGKVSAAAALPQLRVWCCRYAHSAVAYMNEYIYVTGGLDTNDEPLSTVAVYSITANNWTTVQSLPFQLHSHVSTINPRTNNLWIYGGITESRGSSRSSVLTTCSSVNLAL